MARCRNADAETAPRVDPGAVWWGSGLGVSGPWAASVAGVATVARPAGGSGPACGRDSRRRWRSRFGGGWGSCRDVHRAAQGGRWRQIGGIAPIGLSDGPGQPSRPREADGGHADGSNAAVLVDLEAGARRADGERAGLVEDDVGHGVTSHNC